MNISKKRLIQIIKEELVQEAAPGFDVPARDMEVNEPIGAGGTDPTAVAANILSIIGSHAQPEHIILAFVELLNSNQKQHLAQILVSSLVGGDPMAMTPPSTTPTPEDPGSEYGQKSGMGFVKTREDLERMIGNELSTLLEKSDINEAIEDDEPHGKEDPPRTLYDDGNAQVVSSYDKGIQVFVNGKPVAQGFFDRSADAFFIKTPGVPGEQPFNDVPELVQHYASTYNPEGMTF
jgi:hypothetical protein